jgi:Carbon-nitrogen hydrolase/Putative transposase
MAHECHDGSARRLKSGLLPHPRRDGSTHLLLDPLELIEQLSVLIPAPRFHTLRFHGLLAPHSSWRSQMIPRPGEAVEQEVGAAGKGVESGAGSGSTPPSHSPGLSWAALPYYPYFSYVQRPFEMGAEHLRLHEQAVTVPSAATHAIGEACKQAGMVVSIGVNERDGGTLYDTQLLFDADGTLIQCRRKISPTYHERMIWGQGDGSGLRAVDSAVGRIGQLACWEHYNPLARYALMADGEQIHSAMYSGSFAGDIFSEQIQVNIRQHALESGCFVVNATGWTPINRPRS